MVGQDRWGLLCLILLVTRPQLGSPGAPAYTGLGPTPTCVLEQQVWGLPQGKPAAEESQREGVSGLGRPQQEVELSTSVTDGHVTSQVGGKEARPPAQG